MVLPSNTTNIFLFLSSIPTMMRFDFICKNAEEKKRDQLLRAPSSVGRYNLTRVDEGRKC